jgi:hypothetical protein
LIRLLPFLKTQRDSERTTRQVIDTFDRLVPKSLPQATNPLLRHLLLHALYCFLKYSTDVSCISRPFLKGHTEALAAYAQGFIPAWSKGEFSVEAEDSIWESLSHQNGDQKNHQTGRRANISFEVDADAGAVLRALIRKLQGRAEGLIQSGDEGEMKRLTAAIQRATLFK